MKFGDSSLGLRARVAALALVAALVAAPAQAQSNSNQEAGIGALSAVASLVYGPVKLLYASGGLLIGGLAWGLSGGDAQVARAVITPAVQGDYLITADMIRGRQRPEFYGRDPRYRDADIAQLPPLGGSAPLIEEEY
jgi:hypothetical protein